MNPVTLNQLLFWGMAANIAVVVAVSLLFQAALLTVRFLKGL